MNARRSSKLFWPPALRADTIADSNIWYTERVTNTKQDRPDRKKSTADGAERVWQKGVTDWIGRRALQVWQKECDRKV